MVNRVGSSHSWPHAVEQQHSPPFHHTGGKTLTVSEKFLKILSHATPIGLKQVTRLTFYFQEQ